MQGDLESIVVKCSQISYVVPLYCVLLHMR